MPSLPMSLVRSSLVGVLFLLLTSAVAAMPSICQSSNHNASASATARPIITYALSRADVIHYVDRSDIMSALERAVDGWARVIPFVFAATDGYDEADVKVAFFRGDHGEGFVFRPRSSMLAYSELVADIGYVIRLSKYKRWSVDFSKEPPRSLLYDLETVFKGEMGRVLGVGDSSDKMSVMYPSTPYRTKQHITQEDAKRVQVLCGSNPNFDTSTLPSDSSA